MSIRQRLKRLEEAAVEIETCPVCAPGPIETVEDFDDSPLPPDDTRSFEELCKIPFFEVTGPPRCPRCGGPMPIRLIRIGLHPACRHPDHRKRAPIHPLTPHQ